MTSELEAVSLAKTAKALTLWFDVGPRSAALGALMDAMSFVSRVTHGAAWSQRPDLFLNHLRNPIDWTEQSRGEVLIDEEGPTSLALDLVSEWGADPEAEVVQALVGGARDALARLPDAQDRYVAFRRFIIQSPISTEDLIFKALQGTALDPGDLFEEIPSAFCTSMAADAPMVYPCPRCRWPMRISSSIVRCESAACRTAGASFARKEKTLLPLGSLAPLPPVEATARLKRGPWRYTNQPGLDELELFEKVASLGAHVELWPHLDRWDLSISVGDVSWRLDVKDWSNEFALAAATSKLANSGVDIVVPDRRSAQLRILRLHAPTGLRYLSCADVLREVAARKKGAA